MPRLPAKRRAQEPVVIGGASRDPLDPLPSGSPFLRFHATSTEFVAAGGKARIRSRTTRLEEGKLTTESFEGEVDRNVYDRAVERAGQQWTAQMALFLRAFASLLPFANRRPRDDV